jgi:hypothetical protein
MPFFVRRGPVALCLLALSGWLAAATLYKWVDADGVVHYSDTPHPGAEKLQVSGAQTYHNTPVPATAGAPNAATAPPPAAGSSYACAITDPANDAALYAPESVSVSVQASPALREGDSISATVDGQALTPVTADGQHFLVLTPERGSHTVSAQIRGADGSVLCNAAPITFSVQRPSVNSPASPIKPH